MNNVCFIGTGLMGFPMAKNLLKSGVKLKVFNRTVKKADPLKNFGAEISSSIGEVVKNCDFIITMLTDDVAVDMVMSNVDFLENLKIGSILIDMSSVKPSTAIKYGKIFKSKNINYLDAPVSGGTIGAEEGSLAIMVGGEQTIFDKSTDILKIMGKPELVGPIGSGQVSKLANQIIVGITIGAVAESITLCEKTGTDPIKLIKALSGGWADSKILQTHGMRMIKKDFSPKGKTLTQLKDMNNILETAELYNTHLPISNLVKGMYKSLVDRGHENTDHSSLYNEIERINKK
tara:strand:- start:544 stop:1413 length:870 start_codon:yes stop_codon:yes gene_type:complete